MPITVLDNLIRIGLWHWAPWPLAKPRRGAQLKIGGGAARSYFLHLQEKNKMGKVILSSWAKARQKKAKKYV